MDGIDQFNYSYVTSTFHIVACQIEFNHIVKAQCPSGQFTGKCLVYHNFHKKYPKYLSLRNDPKYHLLTPDNPVF